MVGSILGNRVRRVEDPELIDGRSTYVDDLRLPGTAHAVFVRSPLAHATITHLDTSNAERAPGVLAVHTSATLGRERVPSFAEVHELVGHGPLADGAVRFVGDPVALVVAETRAQAVDAAELVDVDYDLLEVVVDMEEALAPGAPLQFPEVGSNVAESVRKVYPPGSGDALADAEIVVRARIENQRIATAPIEGNAILVDPRPDGDTLLTAYVATQHPHMTRDMLAKYTGLTKQQLRVVAPHVGGAFGGKAGISFHHGAIVAAARALGRPVAWTETRSEAMLSMHGRAAVQFAELGLTRDGPDHRAPGPQHRRLRRLRRVRRHPRHRAGPHHGPGPLRDPEDRLLGRRGDDQHRAERRLPRCRASRGVRHAGAADGPGGGRARAHPGGAPPPQPDREGRVPLHDPDRPDLRRRRLRGGPGRGAAHGRCRRAARRAGPPDRGRRGAAARHRCLDVRRDHRLRRQGARRASGSSRTGRPR